LSSRVSPPAGSSSVEAGPFGRFEVADGIAWLWLDERERPVNTLSSRLFGWLDEVLARLEAAPPAHGLVIASSKADGFVAGADLEELRGLADAAAVRRLVTAGHALTGRLAALPFPTVAAIHGPCLGGGLELALACRYRVAADDAATRLGFPEVQLGLIPGLGGTQRLPRLIGVTEALPLILTGRRVSGEQAYRRGLVDAVCHRAQLARVAAGLLLQPPAPGARGRSSTVRTVSDWAARLPAVRRLVFDRARRQVDATTDGHYPAPRMAIEVMERGLALPLAAALAVETEAFAGLVVSPACRALTSIFFLTKSVEARAARLAKRALPVRRVGVVGAGFMGAGVAQGLSARGMAVVLKDRDAAGVAAGMARCASGFERLAERRRLRAVEQAEAMARIHGAVDYRPLAGCELVIEAVFEELAIKQAVLRALEAVARDDQIFASNTSTLPIAQIAAASRRPESVVGMHFFSPVHKMPLVEVIAHPASAPAAVATAVAVARRMGKTPIVVRDGAGFFTSRVLAPYLNEAVWCLLQGATIEEVDRALSHWGWPVGPLALLDEVGLDIAGHSAAVMQAELGERFAAPSVFETLLGSGRAGRKTGRGFYRYRKGGKQPDRRLYRKIGWRAAPVSEQEIAERCWMQMLNETARAIEDGIVSDPGDVDLAVILGFGFPPFRGGLLREADRLGAGYIVERLDTFAEVYGERLRPAPLLVRMAERGERFHPA
jgi:3-hydroxyacyl-CoA dehydrogenase/enoyl-CoA hydratase/3-hydroxybutyryl-CoA epimerase